MAKKAASTAVRNPHIGEVDLFGTRILLTAGAWIAVETRLQKSVIQILQDASEMQIGFREIQVLIEEGANAWRHRFAASMAPFTTQDAMDLIEEHGLELLDPLGDAIQGSPALGLQLSKDKEAVGDAPLV